MWFDAHNHLQDARLKDVRNMIHDMREAGISSCVVNATREEDWPNVAELTRCHPDLVIPAFGIHPWNAHTVCEGWQDRLRDCLEAFPMAGIGECGVDGWIRSPDRKTQMTVFLSQLKLSRDVCRPITIHALKSWETLFEAFSIQAPPPRFLMHSYGGSWEIAERLLKLGACFGFSGHFLQPRKHAILDVFCKLPLERIVLETDAPDMTPPPEWLAIQLTGKRNHPANLPSIGAGLAQARKMPVEELAASTRANAEACFVF